MPERPKAPIDAQDLVLLQKPVGADQDRIMSLEAISSPGDRFIRSINLADFIQISPLKIPPPAEERLFDPLRYAYIPGHNPYHFFQVDELSKSEMLRIKEQPKRKLSLIEIAQREHVLWQMGRNGIEQAEQMMKFVEHHFQINKYNQIPAQKLAQLLEHLNPDDQKKAQDKLGQAVSRFHKMLLFPMVSDLNSEAFVDWVSITADMNEPDFDRVYKQLGAYSFLHKGHYFLKELEMDSLFDIFEAGGLTAEQKNHFDKAEIVFRVGGWDALSKNGTMSIPQATAPQIVDRVESYAPRLANFVEEADFKVQKGFASEFVKRLDDFQAKGGLEQLDQLTAKGWNLVDTHRRMNMPPSGQPTDLIIRQLQEAVKFSEKVEDVEFVRRCQQVFWGSAELNPMLADMYQKMIENKDELTALALIMNKLPRESATFDRIFYFNSQQQEIQINYLNLGIVISQTASHEYQSAEGHGLAMLMEGIMRERVNRKADRKLKASDLPAFAYMISHIDNPDFNEGRVIHAATLLDMDQSGVLTDFDIVQQLLIRCRDVEALPAAFVVKHLDKFVPGVAKGLVLDFTPEFINTLNDDERNFIEYISQNIKGPELEFVFEHKSNFSKMVVDGKPTEAFLMQAQQSNKSLIVNQLLEQGIIDRLPDDKKPFWRVFQTLPSFGRTILFENPETYSELITEGKPNLTFLEKALVTGQFIDASGIRVLDQIVHLVDTETFPPQDKGFWDFYKKSPIDLKVFIVNKKDHFAEWVIDGNPTPDFYKALFKENRWYVNSANKEAYIEAFGEEVINQFLNVLPKRTDEKRNAFTHNNYDRTTEFLQYLQLQDLKFEMDEGVFEVLTPFVSQFGLAKNILLYQCFSNLYLLEQGKIDTLLPEIQALGIRSTAELEVKMKEVSRRVYSTEPMTDLSDLTPFEIQILSQVTGKNTHSFNYGRPTMETIVTDFQRDMQNGEIKSLDEAYKPVALDLSKITIEFDPEPVRSDFTILQAEILQAINDPVGIEGLVSTMSNSLTEKISLGQELLMTGVSRDGRAINTAFVSREITNMEQYLAQLSEVQNSDDLMIKLLNMRFSDTDQQKVVNGVFRQIIFDKVFRKSFSPDALQEITSQLEKGISASSIETVINVVDELAKTHVLNMQNNNLDRYWTDEAFEALKKQGKNVPRCFSPYIGKLKETVEKFEKVQTGRSDIQVIPDRGFVGEMSSYLANVCYSQEYPLLKNYPDLVPYKFVVGNSESGSPEFMGSVLLFPLKDSAGNNVFMMRAFDVPNESTIDVSQLIESFLDDVVVPAAKQVGITKVLVPGVSGAISNYHMSINHISQNYIQGKSPVSLSERFNFNGYDLTNKSFVVREIPSEELSEISAS